jgi:replication factor C large subunit
MDFLEKYRPSTLSDVVGNGRAIEELKKWAQSWPQDKKAALLYGRPGTGKTSSAISLANDMGWEAIELNASDQRTQQVINRIAGEASRAESLFGGRRLIMLDEIDNLHGNADRGGARAVTELVRRTRQPIILIANDLRGVTSALRAYCKPIQFYAVREESIRKVLNKILRQENVTVDSGFIDEILKNAHGDVRSAINDLQANLGQLSPELAPRDRAQSIFEFLRSVFTDKDMKKGLTLSYDLDETPEDTIHWIDENLPRAYSGEQLVKGFAALSRADIYLGRTRRRQSYSMWRYAAELMTCGVNVESGAQRHISGKYSPPTRWMKLGQTRSKRAVRDSIAAKIGRISHTSASRARSDMLPLIRQYAQHDPSSVAAMLNLTIDELAYLMDVRKESKNVQKAFEKAQEMQAADNSLRESEEEHSSMFNSVH